MLRFQGIIHSKRGNAAAALAVTFDQAFSSLQRLPRLFIEPDGSFVWTGVLADGEKWQVDGNLIDQGEVLAYVELIGRCPEAELNAVLETLGWPTAELLFQLPARGIFLEEAEFRRQAESDQGAC